VGSQDLTMVILNAGIGEVTVVVGEETHQLLPGGSSVVVEGCDIEIGNQAADVAAGVYWVMDEADEEAMREERRRMEAETRAVTKDCVTGIAQLYDDNRSHWLSSEVAGTAQALPLLESQASYLAELGLTPDDLHGEAYGWPYIRAEVIDAGTNSFGHRYYLTWRQEDSRIHYSIWSRTGETDADGAPVAISQEAVVD
jgi:hypothetical protein